MAHSFKTYPARPTFGVLNAPLDAGEYIKNKRAIATFCSANVCKPSRAVNTQSNLLMLNKANYLNFYQAQDINKTNLYINLLTTLDLSGVPVLQNNLSPFTVPATLIDPDSLTVLDPFQLYLIDPSGNLFGNTTCGIYNFENYLVYNNPNNST